MEGSSGEKTLLQLVCTLYCHNLRLGITLHTIKSINQTRAGEYWINQWI
jgi:hypothetical protein